MLIDELKKYFGYDEFRQGQEEIIQAILDKKNVLGIMPTGAGKSLCYQLPSFLSETYSIIISPLISLMQDQVDSLNQKQYSAAFINSSLDYRDTEKVLNDLSLKKIKMLFIAPEKLNNIYFVDRLKHTNPQYLFVDEAHCISEWGHNFRPSYRNIKNFTKELNIKNISAFTATATPEVREDIINQLEFENPISFVYGFERKNLSLSVLKTKSKKEKIFELLKQNKSSAIIYASTRKKCEELTEFLKLNSINAEFYHAGLTTELRKVIQDDFQKNNLDVIVATNAFGMGIDKPDIGMVIHYNIPSSLENLYQEFGRAGRNGNEAKAFLFFSEGDKYIQDFLIKVSNPTVEQIKVCYDALLDYHRIAVYSITTNKLEIDDQLLRLIESKSINQTQLNSALQILEQSKYLKLYNPSQSGYYFNFLIEQNKLKNYTKKLINAELKDFIIALVREYGHNAFERKGKIDINKLQALLDETRNSIERQLFELNKIGIIDLDQPNYFQTFEMIQERVRSKDLHLNTKEIYAKIDNANEKLDSVIDYCFTKECRFKFVLNYFGEKVQNYRCNKCDNCTNNEVIDETSSEYLSEMILRTLKEFKGGISSSRLIGILTGKSKSYTAKTITTFQSCSNYNAVNLQEVITELISRKIIKEIGEKLFNDPIEELEEADNQNKATLYYESNLELFNKLREERNSAAKKFAQNPEMICSDSILRNIVKLKPTSPTSFLNVDGVNQRMYNKVGLEFLEIIKEYKTKIDTETIEKDLPKHITQTYSLVKKGYSLSEISNLLRLSESIISIQIETIVSYYPKEKFSNLIAKEEFEEIKKQIFDLNEDIKEIKKRLSQKITYAKIRIVKALLAHSQNFSL